MHRDLWPFASLQGTSCMSCCSTSWSRGSPTCFTRLPTSLGTPFTRCLKALCSTWSLKVSPINGFVFFNAHVSYIFSSGIRSNFNRPSLMYDVDIYCSVTCRSVGYWNLQSSRRGLTFVDNKHAIFTVQLKIILIRHNSGLKTPRLLPHPTSVTLHQL